MNNLPPKWAQHLLTRFHPEETLEEVEGDLEELYALWLQKSGKPRADLRYCLSVLMVLPPFVRRRKKREYYQPSNLGMGMLRNYFKIAVRNLAKNKSYTLLNMGGLTLGLAVGIIILLWVQNELSYDSFHKNAPDTYRVLANMGKGADRQIWANTHAPLATFAKADIPEVVNVVRLKDNRDFSLFTYREKELITENNGYVDPSFFSVFDFTLLSGDKQAPFKGNNSVILTASTAKRYFGVENPIGKILIADGKENFVVTGIIEDFPENSTIRYNMLFPMDLYASLFAENHDGKSIDADWGNFNYTTFIQLAPNKSTKLVAEKMAKGLITHFKDIGIEDPYGLQALSDIHLYKTDGSEGLIQIVRIFLIIAFLILGVACINYVNLSTARAMLRAREVGVRKIIGAGKTQLFAQFIVETTLVFIGATVAAVLLIQLLIPAYNAIADKELVLRLTDLKMWLIIGLTLLGTLALSSIYPALLLSSFEPLKALKGKLMAGMSATFLRKGLVTTQFAVSVILIIGTLAINQQLTYINNKELGYDKEYVFTFGMKQMENHAKSIKTELLNQQGIKGISYAGDQIINLGTTTGKTDWEGKDPEQRFFIHPISIDEDFFSVFKLQLSAGEGFKGIASDSGHYILNETAVKEAGITNPIGKRFRLWDKEGIIIGVVKDFHFASLKQKIEPAIFQYQAANYEMYIKTTSEDAPQAIATVEKLWKQYNAGFPFEYTFLDDTYSSLYQSEKRIGVLFEYFAAVAILISCLGLFGLATFTAQQRIKEIGVRKVLGASTASVVVLLSKDFLQLVLLSVLVASPIAWYLMDKWLQDFAYHINISLWIFALAALIAISIALFTISFQSIKAALVNPVKSLKSE